MVLRCEYDGKKTEELRIPIFLYVAKTGGVTVGTVLGHMFSGRTINRFGGPTSSALGLQPAEWVTAVVREDLPNTLEPRLIVGHIPFGVHEEVQNYRYFTLVRDPQERVVSSYYYLRRIKTLPIAEVLNRLSFAEYVSARFGLDPHDYQVRILPGKQELDGALTGNLIDDYREVTDADLQLAFSNIDQHFIFVGLTERLEETMLLLRRLYGWKFIDLLAEKQNVGLSRPEASRVSAQERQLIEENNVHDRALYTECEKRFNLLIETQGWRFRQEARIYRMACWLSEKGKGEKRAARTLGKLLDWFQSLTPSSGLQEVEA